MKVSVRLSIALNSSAMPDVFRQSDGAFEFPSDDFVISRDSSGNVVSRFGNVIWNLTSYSNTGPCTFNWTSWSDEDSELKSSIDLELKRLCFGILYFSRKRVTAGTLRSTVSDLRRLASIALDSGCTLSNSSESLKFQQRLKSSLSASKRSALEDLHSTYVKLLDIQYRHPKLCFSFTSTPLKIVLSLLEITPKSGKQVPIVPTRLYSKLIANLSKVINDFLASSAAIHETFHTRHSKDPSYGLNKITARSNGSLHCGSKSFEDVAKELSLESYFSSNNIVDNRNLISHLSTIQLACKWYIHIFSGMRDTECRTLPLDALETIDSPSGLVHILNGYTSKLTGDGQKRTYWITSQEVVPALKCAQAIAEINYIRHDVTLSDRKRLPLFPAVRFDIGMEHPGYGIPLAKLAAALTPILLNRLDVLIEERDIEELELFDGFRDWRSEDKFGLGKAWPFTSHQARRSLAVYAARSGLVSIGALSLQLKHLTIAMTSYYMNNASFAENFVCTDSQKELVAELNTQRKIAEFIAYDNNVINTKSTLFGGEGTRIQRIKDRTKVSIELDRKHTQRKFFNGEMSYRPTIIGGCSLNAPCSKISFTNVLTCTGCAHSILDESSIPRIENALHSLERKKILFSSNSASYQQLENEESALRDFLMRSKNSISRKS